MATKLLLIRFFAALTQARRRELKLLTGMRIGDTDNPYKDTPGSGTLAGVATVLLSRGERPEEWYITAFTHAPAEVDLQPLERFRQRLAIALPKLADRYEEVHISPAIPIEPGAPNGDALVERGLHWVEQGCYDEAIGDFTCALALQPGTAQILLKRAACLRRQERMGEALIDYTHAQELDPNDPTILNARATVYWSVGRYDLALADVHAALAVDSTLPALHTKLGLLYYTMEQYRAAFAAFTEATRLIGNPDADLYYYHGCTAYRLGLYLVAAEDFAHAARRLDGSEIAAPYDVHFNRAVASLHLGRYEDAVASLTQAIALQPGEQLYVLRAGIYERLGRYLEAGADCDSALRLNPLGSEAYNIRGIALGEQGELGQALADFNQATLLNPNEGYYRRNRASTLARLGRTGEAAEEYDTALLLDPENSELRQARDVAAKAFATGRQLTATSVSTAYAAERPTLQAPRAAVPPYIMQDPNPEAASIPLERIKAAA